MSLPFLFNTYHTDRSELMSSLAHAHMGLPSVAGWFKKIISAYKHQREVNITIAELSRLTDRELNDMGITRGDIYAIAHGDETHQRAIVNKNLKGWV
jgi:uncharacterized protein YjiS (DUF1127 family)